MDTLHLTYNEVWDVIPYRNLVMMQKDKLHTASADTIVRHATGADVMARRMAIINGEQ